MPTAAPTPLSAARDALATRGFAPLGPVLDAATVERLRAELERHLGPNPTPSAYGVLRNNVWEEIPAFEAVIREGTLARLARELLGLDAIVYFQDNLVWKTPGTTARVEWHQDFSYWPLEEPRGITLWLALDPADAENGCLRYLPGTHRLGERAPQDFVEGAEQPASDLPPLDVGERERDAAIATAAPGEVWAHDPLVWHMSPGNATERHRRAWTLTWVTPSNRWDPGHAPHPFNFRLAPRRGDPVTGRLFPRFEA